MKLSKLTYLCIKNAVYKDDSAFTYNNFINGNYNNSPDYAMNIVNVYSPLNEAIARLSDLEKIPYFVEQVDINENQEIDLTSLSKNCKDVLNVAVNGKKVSHRRFGVNKEKILEYLNPLYKYNIEIEYKEDIPYFSNDSFFYRFNSDGTIDEDESFDVELNEHGISDAMCNFIIEYASGRLMENYDPSISNMHITRAEQYFNNMRTSEQALAQGVIDKKYSIEG